MRTFTLFFTLVVVIISTFTPTETQAHLGNQAYALYEQSFYEVQRETVTLRGGFCQNVFEARSLVEGERSENCFNLHRTTGLLTRFDTEMIRDQCFVPIRFEYQEQNNQFGLTYVVIHTVFGFMKADLLDCR